MLFTTSWDDGHPDDLRVAALLTKYGMTGTFYACKCGQMGGTLGEGDLKMLAERHEVGAHTLNHPSLPTLSEDEMATEMRGSKEWLENVTGRECTMLAYPYGHHDERAVRAAQTSGFAGARTTEDLLWRTNDPFRITPTIQVHHFPFRPIPNRRFIQPLRTHWKHLRSFGVSPFSMRSWLHMSIAVFRYAVKTEQPWFHLWGHGWSLTRFGLWDTFEEMLKIVRAEPSIRPVTNTELLRTAIL